MARTIAGLLATLAAVVLLAAGVALWGYDWFHRPGPAAVETTVIVERGAALGTIARQLEEAGVVGNARLFLIGTRMLSVGRTLKAGEYAGNSTRHRIYKTSTSRTNFSNTSSVFTLMWCRSPIRI